MSSSGDPPVDGGPNDGGRPPPLEDEDLRVLEAWRRGGLWLRGVFSTLARRGIAFRLAYPERAEALIRALERDPLYKGGQFLFDLMEWEDFMLDGPPTEVVSTTLDPSALLRLAAFLHRLRGHLDGALNDVQPALPRVESVPAVRVESLPPLEGGFYLYQDLVLGIIRSAVPLVEQIRRVDS